MLLFVDIRKGAKTKFSKKDFECACEAEDSSPSSTEMVHTTLNVVSEFKGAAADLVTGRGGGAKPRSQAQSTNAQCPMSQLPLDQVNIQDMAQTNCKANTQTFAQLSCAARNTPATTAPIALITTHPRIQIPSSTVTVDVILCKESKAIFSSATECLCSEDYSHMIPLLEQITQHTCATQHCQALLFRHFGLGLAHYKMADHHEATKHFMEYRSLALRPADISLAHVYLGDISTIKSNYSNAAYHYLEAIHNYGTNNPSTLSQTVEAFRNAIHHAPDINSRLPVHNSLGNLFQSMGDYTEALQEYKKAVKLGEELNDLVSLGWAYGNMGNAHLEHESTPQAISRAYNNLGTAYQSLEDFKGAEENFNLALDQAVYGNDVAGQARARGNLGNLLMLNKKYERAVEQYSEVFRLSKDRQVLSTANHNRGCAYLEWAEQLRSGQNGTTSGISSNLQVLCNSGTMVPSPGFTPTELYRLGASDLTQAIELCNEVLQSTKGSMQGLSLSVSLIESSSRTFHKLQDCLIGLQQMDEALVVAEQCRARTLGERLLEKMGGGVNHLTPPLSLEQIQYIVKSQEHPVVYLSYTGAKLIFEVEKLEKEKFGGKTFDQYVRQSVQEAVLIPALFHLLALHPERNFNNTFGNTFSIQMMPSLLIMGILNEAHPTRAVMYDRRTACVVGNPHIPIFEHNDEEWSLGRLPHATDEAKWISQLLKVQPLLHEQATKVAVVTKLSPAQVIHIATHGSAVSGFLAFAGPDSSNGKPSKSSDILLLPSSCSGEELEQGLIQTASQPSNVQILLGYEGTELTDPVKTFIHSFYDYFRGGVFWISCRSEEVAAACVKKALEVIDEIELKTHNIAALVVLESIEDSLWTSAEDKVSSPSDEDRVALEILVDITKGSPPVIDIMTSKGMSTKYPESLDAFIRRLVFTLDESEPYSNVIDKQPMKARNCVSFDLWNAINTLADLCELTSYEELFLHCLCIFHNVPVPKCVLEGLSCLIKRSYSQLTSCQEMYQKLVEFNLLKSYPHPVVLCPTGGEVKEAPPCYGVAPVVATAIWNGKMNDTDKVMALGIVYRVFEDIYSNRHILSSSELQHVFGLVCVVLEVCNCICYLIGEECYQLFYLMLEDSRTYAMLYHDCISVLQFCVVDVLTLYVFPSFENGLFDA
eukprot:Em0272g4a